MSKCGIKHGFHDGTCTREIAHDGPCRCKAERGRTGTVTYSEWYSRDGKFHRHKCYQTIHPANAVKDFSK